MNTSTPLDYVTAIGAIATPILVLILTGIGWTVRNRIEKARDIEEKLRDDRIAIYNSILEPFIILLTKDEAFHGKSKTQIASEKILSLTYKQTAFKLALMGSDDVVRAYNRLMQFFYTQENTPQQNSKSNAKELMELLGSLLLEIRKSVGNERTDLSNIEMLEWLITDIRKLG